jgi:hypothetical protein
VKRIAVVAVGVFLVALAGAQSGHAYVVSQGSSGPSYYGSSCLSEVCPPIAMGPPVQAMGAGAMAAPMGTMFPVPKRITKCRPGPPVGFAPPMYQPQACGPAMIPVCRPPVRWY